VRSKGSQANMDSQLVSRFETGPVSHKVLGGFNLKRFTLDDMQGFGDGAPISLINPVYTPTAPFSDAPYRDAYVTQNQVALYLQDQIKFDRLTLVLSGRNDWVGTVDNDLARSYQTRNDSKFSGRGGIIYNFDFGLAPYASYATSYNPIIGINGATGNLLPQTAVQSEVGLKYQPTGLNARFGVALFDLKRQNALTTDPNNPQLTIQNGEVTSRGLEPEAVANITRDFKITASYTNFNFFVSRDLDTSLIGTVPVSTPRELASLWTDYTFREGALSGFGLGGGVRYVGSSFANTANTLPVPAVVLGDLAVHYEWGDNWRAAVNFINVADTIYVAKCSSSDSCFYGDRRRITGSLSYKW
jgi:iron complex outermembrane receptor protein